MPKQTISDRILQARTEAELTQQAAADAIGVAVSQWCRWEKGSTPRVDRLETIAEILGVSLAWLVTGK